MVGEESDENGEEKPNRRVVRKTTRKEDGTKVNKEDGENNDGNDQKKLENDF